mmetsp:Transcript_12188/g.30321  ORF Transcript_12188/g.30321 Transcript_12188/m.30321 type:complete len:231 (+) Transcript_12188:455-1147(+)
MVVVRLLVRHGRGAHQHMPHAIVPVVQRRVEVIPLPADECLRPHVPAEMAARLLRAAIRVDLHAAVRHAVDGRAALLHVHQPVAHARGDLPRLEHRGEQDRMLRAVARAGARGLGGGGVGGGEVLRGDVRMHQVPQRVGDLHLVSRLDRLATPAQPVPRARKARVDLVGEVDDDRVGVVHHGRGGAVVLVYKLFGRGFLRVLQINRHLQVRGVAPDFAHSLEACRWQFEF